MARKTVLHIYKRIHGYNGKKKKTLAIKNKTLTRSQSGP